jgi:hypothetical protein
MLRRHMTFERELVEQRFLPAPTFPHHRFAPQSPQSPE